MSFHTLDAQAPANDNSDCSAGDRSLEEHTGCLRSSWNPTGFSMSRAVIESAVADLALAQAEWTSRHGTLITDKIPECSDELFLLLHNNQSYLTEKERQVYEFQMAIRQSHFNFGNLVAREESHHRSVISPCWSKGSPEFWRGDPPIAWTTSDSDISTRRKLS